MIRRAAPCTCNPLAALAALPLCKGEKGRADIKPAPTPDAPHGFSRPFAALSFPNFLGGMGVYASPEELGRKP